MGLFSKSKPAAGDPATELPITSGGGGGGSNGAGAGAGPSTAASTAGSTALTIPDETAPLPPGGRSAKSTPAIATTPPVQADKPSRASSAPVPPPHKKSSSALAATASPDDAAFDAKYAHLTPAERRTLKQLDALATTLDSKWSVGPVKIGYESVIGMIPFAGDVYGATMGTYIIGNALHLGMPKRLVARMALNVGLDTAVGFVPFVGDIFDIAHKANSKNLALLKLHLEKPRRATAADTAVLCGAFCCVVVLPCLIVCGVIAGIIILILWLCKAIFN